MKHLSKLLKSAVFFTPPKFFYFHPPLPPRFSDKVKYYLINFLPTLVRSFVRSFIRSFIRSSGLKFLSAFSKNHSFILKLICVGGWITLHGTSCTHLQSHKTQAKQAAATTTPQSKEGGSRGLAGGRSDAIMRRTFGVRSDKVPKRVRRVIKEWANHRDPLIRIEAIKRMTIHESHFMEMLSQLSQDPEPSVRAAVAKSLRGHSDFSISLLRYLAKDENPDVLQAVITSRRVDDYNDREMIREIAENKSPEIKMELIERFSHIELTKHFIDNDSGIIFLMILLDNRNREIAQEAQRSFLRVMGSEEDYGKEGAVNLFEDFIPTSLDFRSYHDKKYSNLLIRALENDNEFRQRALQLLIQRRSESSMIMAARISIHYANEPEIQPLLTRLSQAQNLRVRVAVAENLRDSDEFSHRVLLNLAQDQRIDVVQAVIRNDSWWITNAVPVHEILLTIARDQSPEIKMKLINSVSNSDKENIFLALLLKDKDQDIVQAAGEKLIQSLEGLRLPRNSPTQKVIVEKLDPNTELGRNIAKQVIRSSEDGDALYEIKRKFREAGLDF